MENIFMYIFKEQAVILIVVLLAVYSSSTNSMKDNENSFYN